MTKGYRDLTVLFLKTACEPTILNKNIPIVHKNIKTSIHHVFSKVP
jgi:hypothetical protein